MIKGLIIIAIRTGYYITLSGILQETFLRRGPLAQMRGTYTRLEIINKINDMIKTKDMINKRGCFYYCCIV